jgi:hypothetical protein
MRAGQQPPEDLPFDQRREIAVVKVMASADFSQ